MTNQMNNGQNTSTMPIEQQATEEKWKIIEKQIQDYQNTLCLNIHKNEKIEEILNLNTEQLRNLHAEDCGIYGYILIQYSTFLQKEINRHSAKNKWANHNLEIMIGKYGQEYGDKFTRFDEKKAMLIADNSYAKALNEIVKFSSVICEDLSFLAKKIETMSNHLLELQRTKRGSTYEKGRSS